MKSWRAVRSLSACAGVGASGSSACPCPGQGRKVCSCVAGVGQGSGPGGWSQAQAVSHCLRRSSQKDASGDWLLPCCHGHNQGSNCCSQVGVVIISINKRLVPVMRT